MYPLHSQPVITVTELGTEKRCVSCGEYWPVDAEFFRPQASSRDHWSARCIACIRDKVWQWIRPLGQGGTEQREDLSIFR